MQETVRSALRMRDVALVLLAVKQYDLPLNRIGIQKLIYLLDSSAIIFEILPPAEGHETYKHGPYDRYIQNAVDCLCFRGLVQIVRSVPNGNTLSTGYRLTPAGDLWANQIIAEITQKARWELVGALTQELTDADQWAHLRELVYAEPTFMSAKPFGWGQKLNVGDAAGRSTAGLMQLAETALRSVVERPPTRELLVSLFVKYLVRNAFLERSHTQSI
jgi:hypothetical protein